VTGAPAFVVPRVVRAVVSRLPALPPTIACAAALSIFARRALPRDELAALDGRTFRVVVDDAGLAVAFRVRATRVEPLPASHAVDVTFAACAADLLAIATRREDPDTLFFARRLSIDGDTDTGHRLKNILDAVELPSWLASIARRGP
jgi:predicted lipid carrier protein YhbT